MLRLAWPLALSASLSLAACGKDKPAGDGSGDDIDDVEEPGGDSGDAPDTDTDALPANVAELLDVAGFQDTTDVAAGADAVWAMAFNDRGQAAVVRVDLAGGTAEEVFSGPPLTFPSGVALSPDGGVLLVSDIASEPWNDALTSGGVYLVDPASAAATEIGTWGHIDTPGDVTFGPDGTTVYISGMTPDTHEPAIFSLSLSTGMVTRELVGAPLVDPLQIDVTPDGSRLYVVDGLAGPGQRAALLSFSLPAFAPTRVVEPFDVNFPGGVAASEDGTTVFVSAIRPSHLTQVASDGSGFEVIDTVGVFELPSGLSERAGILYVAETSELSGADIYTVAW